MKRTCQFQIFLFLLVFWCVSAAAEVFPSKPIRLIVPYTPGGISDIVARLIADSLKQQAGWTVIVENRAGAACNIGSDYVVKSPPDGHTIGLINLGCLSINPRLYKNYPFDPLKDVTAIATVGETAHVLFASSALPLNSVSDVISFARRFPGKLNYGSGGAGTPLHTSAEYFSHLAGIQLTHVPYKSLPSLFPDLSEGRIDLVFWVAEVMRPHVLSGRVKPIAVAGGNRLASLPEVPTFEEAGLTGFKAGTTIGLIGPRGIPPEIVGILNRQIAAMLASEATRKKFSDMGLMPLNLSPRDFGSLIKTDYERWQSIARERGFTAE